MRNRQPARGGADGGKMRLTRHYNANDSYNHYQIYHGDDMTAETAGKHEEREQGTREKNKKASSRELA